jgi:spermidine/putrescine transport system substrate-binding protein
VRTLRALGCLLAALLSAGCTRGSGDAAQELNLFAWSEYVPQEVIDGFTEKTGIRVNYDGYASNEEMLAKLLSGAERYDLVQPSEYTVEALVAAGQLAPLDHARLPNLVHVAPEFRNLPHDPEQRFTVPYMGGTVGIVVNTERVGRDVQGYADVFREEHAGRIVVVDDPREMVTWALATKGHGPNDVTPATLAEVRPVLARWLPLVKVFDSDSPKTALLNGDVDLGVVWSGEAARLHDEDPRFRWVLPAEGAHRFVDSLAIPVGARNPDAAHAFMNWVLEPEVSRMISREFPYTNPNLAARKLLTPEERANPASYPPDGTKLETFRDVGDVAVQIDKLVTDLKAKGG